MEKQEQDERDTVQETAVQALKNELELAVRLLYTVKAARETMALEAEAIASARNAFRHATEALNRLPQLPFQDMREVELLMNDFRAVLSDLSD